MVEIEEALNAAQVVEPVRGIQFCANVIESEHASRTSKNGFFIAPVLLFNCIILRRFLCEPTKLGSQVVLIELLAWSAG